MEKRYRIKSERNKISHKNLSYKKKYLEAIKNASEVTREISLKANAMKNNNMPNMSK